MNRKKLLTLISIIAFLILVCIFAFDTTLKTSYYIIEANKLTNDIKICFVADLHSCNYGEGNVELLTAINSQNPDVILLGGDIFDDDLPNDRAYEFCSSIVDSYPCFYVTGNHEYWSGQADEIKNDLSEMGIIVLSGDSKDLNIKESCIQVLGIDDPCVGWDKWEEQLSNCSNEIDKSNYTIFLTHRPELIQKYQKYDFDLILSGHAHGGQWRIPFLLNGLYAPNQGFFPKYVGGEYNFGKQTMIVSRGLAKESTRSPRIFNRPELVIITVK